jgi:hypothetical protein
MVPNFIIGLPRQYRLKPKEEQRKIANQPIIIFIKYSRKNNKLKI